MISECCGLLVLSQALEAARKALQKREAELAEASAECEAAAGEREQVNEQVAASDATIKGMTRGHTTRTLVCPSVLQG